MWQIVFKGSGRCRKEVLFNLFNQLIVNHFMELAQNTCNKN